MQVNSSIIFVFLIFVTCHSCTNSQVLGLEEILGKKIDPPEFTYAADVRVKGTFVCEYGLSLLITDKVMDNFVFEGSVDTLLFSGDWYGDPMSFTSSGAECDTIDAIVELYWHHQ